MISLICTAQDQDSTTFEMSDNTNAGIKGTIVVLGKDLASFVSNWAGLIQWGEFKAPVLPARSSASSYQAQLPKGVTIPTVVVG
jgi:hypothetical protein